MVSFAIATLAINSGNYGTGLLRFQIDCCPVHCFLVADRENAPILARTRYIVPQQMLYKTTNGPQPTIPCNSGIPAVRFDVIQEREHGVRFNIIEG
jgi:hypothetical protein